MVDSQIGSYSMVIPNSGNSSEPSEWVLKKKCLDLNPDQRISDIWAREQVLGFFVVFKSSPGETHWFDTFFLQLACKLP